MKIIIINLSQITAFDKISIAKNEKSVIIINVEIREKKVTNKIHIKGK